MQINASRTPGVSLPAVVRLRAGTTSGGQPYNAYAALLREVAERTARLFAHWHRVGFVHGAPTARSCVSVV